MSSEGATQEGLDGYKQVQVGPKKVIIPSEWDMRPIGELFDIKKESFDPDDLPPDTEVRLYSMPAFDDGREPVRTSPSEIGSKKYHVPEDTILFPKLNIRKRRFWRVEQTSEQPSVCSTEFWPLIPQVSLCLDFYLYYFDSYEFMSDPKITSSSSTNSHKRVREQSFRKLQVPVPPIPEQRRIAEVLSTVDERIQEAVGTIEKAEELKRGLVQDLVFYGPDHEDVQTVQLGPMTTEIAASWDVSTVGDVTTEVQYGSSESLSQDGEYPVFRMNNIENGRMVARPMKYSDLTPEEAEKYHVEKGDILFNRTNSIDLVGKSGIFDLDGDYVFASYLIRIRTNEEMNPYFLNYYLNSSTGDGILKSYATRGASQANINATSLKSVKVPLPPRETQDRIVAQIQTVEQRVEEEKESGQKLQELKRGLMQDLLTGKRRLGINT
jgi:type I restriction enzyme S subunit